MSDTPEVHSFRLLERWKDILTDDAYQALLLTAHANRVSFLFRRRIEVYAAEFGLSQVDAIIMCLLYGLKKEPINFTDIWRIYEYTPGAVTRRISRLRDQGLVVTRKNPRDSRSSDITLTPKGRETIKGIMTPVSDELTVHVRNMGLSPSKMASLFTALSKLEFAAEQAVYANDKPKKVTAKT